MALSTRRNNALFEKDEDTLPFFSIHPKTKVGMILRIILFVFLLIVCIITILADKASLLFYKYFSMYYLIYAVPALIILALILVSLFKRMKRLITKIAVPGVIGLLAVSIGLAVFSLMASANSFVLSPAGVMPTEYGKYMLMRSCDVPDGTTEVLGEDGQTHYEYPVRMEAYRYTGKAFAEENCEVTGEIFIPMKATYEVKEEWLDENTLRFYIASDNSGYGKGEIVLKFGSSSSENVLPGDTAVFRSRFANRNNSHTGDLYREDSFIMTTTDSVYMMGEESLKQVYTVFPLKLRYFLKINARVEGNIILEPYGKINSFVVNDDKENGYFTILPGEDCTGASGSITVYPNETVEVNLRTSAQEQKED